jgi:hypothetical protein
MASNFVFVSPGVKFKERDLSFVSKNVGLTTLGLVGETPKGPAFQPITISSKGDFSTRFGSQSVEKFPNDGGLKFQLPYVANSYLDESDQLVVTRVLGRSGYQAGTAWGLRVSAGVDISTTGVTSTGSTTENFSGGVYLGTTITNVGQTGVIFTGFTKISSTTFSTVLREFTVQTLVAGSGSTSVQLSTISGSSLSEFEGMVVAIVRSRGSVEDIVDGSPITTFQATQLQMTANATTIGAGDMFGKFTLAAGTGTTASTESYVVSLNPDAREFIVNVLGDKPKGKNTKIYVESVYPDLIKKLDADGVVYGISTSIINATTNTFTDYREDFKTPETPYIVSELRGNIIERLFKFVSISDGNAANQEIKISLANIDPITKQFDIIVRDFYDTDDALVVLESFRNCSMQKGLNNYVGNRVGTIDGEYSIQSNFIVLDIDPNAPGDSYPAGFEGYIVFDWSSSSTGSGTQGISPEIVYKNEYAATDRVNRVYLGVSERAFDGDNLIGTGIDQNFFNYNGLDISSTDDAPSGYVKTKGFHMDAEATGATYMDGLAVIGSFVVGAGTFQGAADITNPNNPYFAKNARKFTFVPYGGFDGWNEHRDRRTTTDLYKKGGVYDGVPVGATPNNDFQAWEIAIATFRNSEDVTINLFATPGLNWSDNIGIINDTIEMIEQVRGDSLYVIDAPDLPDAPGLAQDIVDLLDDTDIDSNYSATFYPWVQIKDSINNQNVYIPPTGEVVRAIAFTDNVKFPWFAPAGLQRGVTDAIRTRRKLSSDERDTLYDGRINPMATFPDTGVSIFGQKTLQVAETSLNRINVRRLLLQLRVLISNVAVRLLFEQNDQTTIDEFLAKVNPILETVKRERGLEDFKVVMDQSNNTPETRDRNELYGEIFIKPTKAVEFIGITFTITPSGASFDSI